MRQDGAAQPSSQHLGGTGVFETGGDAQESGRSLDNLRQIGILMVRGVGTSTARIEPSDQPVLQADDGSLRQASLAQGIKEPFLPGRTSIGGSF